VVSMKKIILLIIFLLLVGCSEKNDENKGQIKACGDGICDQAEKESGFCPEDCERVVAAEEVSGSSAEEESSTQEGTSGSDADAQMAFFYQTVGEFVNGVGENAVLIGSTADGATIGSYDQTALAWEQGLKKTTGYGDPVFSHPGDSWTLTSWSTNEDPRGAGAMLYYESSCPFVDDDAVIALNPSTAEGCQEARSMQVGKTSQVFEAEGGTYVFHSIDAKVYLAHLSDKEQSAMDLESLCVLEEPVEDLADLEYGETTLVVSDDDLLLSDSAMGKRADGTWVLFVKAIEKTNDCEKGSLCELCGRAIYRATSSDLTHWSELEKIVSQASVPEAASVDGTVYLYWQDFSNACDAGDLNLANRAHISFSYELLDSYEFAEKESVTFVDEAFETNEKHYATNGNPVALDEEGFASLEECFEKYSG